jgi:hypothetical protein
MTILPAVLIPTRDRAALAIDAVESLRAQSVPLEIYVSDNATNEQDARTLSEYCRNLGDPRLTYLRAPEPMRVGAHWNWALEAVLRRSGATHVTLHYDRKITRPDHLSFLVAAAAGHPDEVITYLTDYVTDDLALWQAAATGALYRVSTTRMLELLSRGEVLLLGQTFPILSNSLVPRAVLEKIRERFGVICSGDGPDVNFGFRFAAIADHSLHLDRALSILRATQVSNGLSYLSGGATDVAVEHAPIAGLRLGNNILYGEYETVRRAAPDRVPPLDRNGYLEDLARGLALVRDDAARAELIGVLRSHGWRGTYAPKRRVRALRGAAKRIVQHGAALLGVHIQRWSGFRHRSDAGAVRYAIEHPRRFRREPSRELVALQAVAIQ